MSLDKLVEGLRHGRGVALKRDIAPFVEALGIGGDSRIAVGDDCAAIPDGDGFLLLAIEGFLNEFVAAEPRFAGWCGVMVNVSDIYAMGGRPTAVVDALWSRDTARGREVLEGMAAAARAYGVPIVGGHSNAACDREQLSVAILGRATRLLTSFDAKPGDALVAAIDLRGAYRAQFSNWDAASGTDPVRLRGDLELLPRTAEAGLSSAAKDISNAGLLGTALMFLECSRVGATIDVEAIPAPTGVDPARWLLHTFPSYGFLLSVAQQNLAEVLARFEARGIAANAIGRCDASRQLLLRRGAEERLAWDFTEHSLTGCAPSATPSPASVASAPTRPVPRLIRHA